MGTMVKIAISISAGELAAIDLTARKRKTTRSELIRTAVAKVLAEEAAEDCRERIDRVFADPQVVDEQRRVAELAASDFCGAEDPW